jgi:predicted nucleotidyltransferase
MLMKKNSIAGISTTEMDRLESVFHNEETVFEVILYGSRAMGTYRSGSDIDLTLKGRGLTVKKLLELSTAIDDLLLPYEIDLSIYEQIENPDLINHISRVGKVIFAHEQ